MREPQAQIHEGRTERERTAILGGGVVRPAHGEIAVGDGGMQVGDLAPRRAVHRLVAVRLPPAPAAGAFQRRPVDLLGALVLSEVVADDGQVEPRLDVPRIDLERLLQRALRRLELAQLVIDHAQHVVDVRERHAAGHRLLEVTGRERVIPALEVLFAEGDELPQLVVHALPVLRPPRRIVARNHWSAGASAGGCSGMGLRAAGSEGGAGDCS